MAWFKLHTDIIDDWKMEKMSEKTFKIFIFLMAFAKEIDESGTIKRTKNEIIWRLRITENDLLGAVKELIDLQILSNKKEILTFINWGKRNFSDSYDRVKKHREKRYSNDNETLQSNTGVTDTRARETEIETEKETEQKQIKEKKSGGKPPHPSHEWYRDTYALIFQQFTHQIALYRAKEFGQARSYFESLSKLNPHAPPEEITRKATLGVEIVFDGWVNERGPFHWLRDPPNIGWLMSNVDKINLAVTARESMTEEEIEREKRNEEGYQRFSEFADRVDAAVEGQEPKQLRAGGGILNPHSGD